MTRPQLFRNNAAGTNRKPTNLVILSKAKNLCAFGAICGSAARSFDSLTLAQDDRVSRLPQNYSSLIET